MPHRAQPSSIAPRPLRNIINIAAHCPAGPPCVITCHPLRRKGIRLTPFPTLYWLTCPTLCRQIAHLERDGAIQEIAAELARDPILQARLALDHQSYIARRWAVLSDEDRLLIAQHGLTQTFQTRGIGGMLNRQAVKCLHLHVAHHLADANALGELIMRRYALHPCKPVEGT